MDVAGAHRRFALLKCREANWFVSGGRFLGVAVNILGWFVKGATEPTEAHGRTINQKEAAVF